MIALVHRVASHLHVRQVRCSTGNNPSACACPRALYLIQLALRAGETAQS